MRIDVGETEGVSSIRVTIEVGQLPPLLCSALLCIALTRPLMKAAAGRASPAPSPQPRHQEDT